MQKKLEHETVAGLMRKEEKKSHILKNSRGITLIALIVTIIVLIILASITISTLTGNNSIINMALTAREKAEISSEREQLEIATAQAMEKNKFGEVRKEILQKVLNNNLGENETEVTEDEESTDLYVKFVPSKRYYIVTRDGKLTYIGDEEKLSKTAEITADPASDPTPKLAHTVTLTVKTGIAMNEENLRLKYAWSKSATQEPEEFTTVELTGSGRTKKASVTTVDTEEGDYYLWVKAFLGENMETEVNLKKPFGPYRIKDHSTLRYCGNEVNTNSKFLNSDTVTRNKVKSVMLVNSLQGHSLDEANCWDVSQEQKGKILAWYDVDENGYYSVTIGQDGGVTANVDSRYLFANIGYSVADGTEVKIEGLENLDTSNVTSMVYMFYACSKLTSIDVTKFDTSNVTNMSGMFCGCSGLTSIDVSKFDTSNVTNMSSMFQYCSGLTSLNVSNFDTSNVTNMGSMFRFDWNFASNLTSLDVSNFDTSKVTSMGSMFYYCNKLTGLDVSNFNTNNVTNMSRMFYNCSKLTSLDVGNFNTSKVTNMSSMFGSCSGLTSLDVSDFDTSNVTNMECMFFWCLTLKSLDVSKFNTSNVTNMYRMFSSCNELTKLDVSKFDTSRVTSYGMSQMFSGCSSLTSLDVSNFDTSNVTNMYVMFSGCSSLTSLDVSNFDTSKVTDMHQMFDVCGSLTELDVSNFDTSKVTDMDQMFRLCNKLTSLDLSSFDTRNVTDMKGMFKDCTNLTSLNVSGLFNTSNVKYMGYSSTSTGSYYDQSGMFSGCSNLTELDLSTWDTSNVESMRGLFYGCTKLNILKLNKFTASQITEPMYYNAMFTNVPTTVQITTNSDMKTWLETNFANWAKNITTI